MKLKLIGVRILIIVAAGLSCERERSTEGQSVTRAGSSPQCDYIQPKCGKYSERLQLLYNRATHVRMAPINIERLPTTRHQNRNLASTCMDERQTCVQVAEGTTERESEAILAHEFYHILLWNEGFRFRPIGSTRINKADIKMVSASLTAILNCFVDPIVDTRMLSSGFDVHPVSSLAQENHRNYLQSILLSGVELNKYRTSRLHQKYLALTLFCGSLREQFRSADAETLASQISPSIVSNLAAIRKKSSKASCKTPEECLVLMRSLREASGLSKGIPNFRIQSSVRRRCELDPVPIEMCYRDNKGF